LCIIVQIAPEKTAVDCVVYTLLIWKFYYS
jgi:hypothetical protein